jgi:hypothetical protein
MACLRNPKRSEFSHQLRTVPSLLLDSPFQAGAFQAAYGDGDDVFVSKLNAAGSAMTYSAQPALR